MELVQHLLGANSIPVLVRGRRVIIKWLIGLAVNFPSDSDDNSEVGTQTNQGPWSRSPGERHNLRRPYNIYAGPGNL